MKSFRETLEEVVKVWQEENPCEDGHDHVTPFDRFFYGNYTLEAPSAPVGVEELVEKWRLEDIHDGERTSFRSASICADELERALAQQPAAVDRAAREYLAARDAYDAATRPPNSHASAPRLQHGDPIVLRLRAARVALDAALAAQPGDSDNQQEGA